MARGQAGHLWGPPVLAGHFLLMVLHVLLTLPLGGSLPQCQQQTVTEPLLYFQPGARHSNINKHKIPALQRRLWKQDIEPSATCINRDESHQGLFEPKEQIH